MLRRLTALLTVLLCAGAAQAARAPVLKQVDYWRDAARDGRSVVFARYDGNAIETWRLELASGGAPPSVLP